MKKLLLAIFSLCVCAAVWGKDHQGIVSNDISEGFVLIENNQPVSILIDLADQKGIDLAAANLSEDFATVAGTPAVIIDQPQASQRIILAGTTDNKYIQQLVKNGKLDISQLKNANEKYQITFVENPFDGISEAMVIAGSDRRGAIYGIYEIAEQIGVSPWHWWADAPVHPQANLAIKRDTYTAGEPRVKYRGIFLNDEAPCLTSWVKNQFGTEYGGHEFYGKVFELILRLRGNFLWPAMWCWAFYADDPDNGKLADEMGVIIGTSHHEPMARNHQEWARHRNEYGKWNYQTNQKVIDKFFTEGIDRMKGTEDVVTIGMRGDGDEAMSEEADVALLEKIIKNQRKIISSRTGKPAKNTPQVWALYKEVLDYYDKGLRAPDDVILLLCDDNWGNVRRLPNAEERKHPGGWGMYYHVDYVGAPRNTKWINVTPIQGMWEQLNLTAEYGVDKLWILNVGDLKPMEYPIQLFLDMAWNPDKYTVDNFMQHPRQFCANIFGEDQADEAARILNLYSKYNGRVTAEMMDASTYNLANGEWQKVRNDYLALEAEALRQYLALQPEYRDAYFQLILFPVQAMANLYDMYYAQAMNHALYDQGDPQCNYWADQVARCFERDKALCSQYNNDLADGKWNGMMTQKHIGYTSWNDDFPSDIMPAVKRLDQSSNQGGYTIVGNNQVAVIEAEHYFDAKNSSQANWTIIHDMGRTLSGVTLMPRNCPIDDASLQYQVEMPLTRDSVDIRIVVKSTLAFSNLDGHRYKVWIEGAEPVVINFNSNLNEAPQNIYSVFYPTVARRVVEKVATVPVPNNLPEVWKLNIQPLDPGIVFEKIIVDDGGYQPSYLFMEPSYKRR